MNINTQVSTLQSIFDIYSDKKTQNFFSFILEAQSKLNSFFSNTNKRHLVEKLNNYEDFDSNRLKMNEVLNSFKYLATVKKDKIDKSSPLVIQQSVNLLSILEFKVKNYCFMYDLHKTVLKTISTITEFAESIYPIGNSCSFLNWSCWENHVIAIFNTQPEFKVVIYYDSTSQDYENYKIKVKVFIDSIESVMYDIDIQLFNYDKKYMIDHLNYWYNLKEDFSNFSKRNLN